MADAPKKPIPVPGSIEDGAMLNDMANAAVFVGKPNAQIQEYQGLGAAPQHFALDHGTHRFSTDPTGHPERDVGVTAEDAGLAVEQGLQDDPFGQIDSEWGATPDISEPHEPAMLAPEDHAALAAPETVAPEPPPMFDPKQKQAASALYGADFPPIKETEPTDGQWCAWSASLWERHRSGMTKTLHFVERNRLYRQGDQWVASAGMGAWREPPKPREAVRAVENVIKPALAQRVQILREQAPGFQCTPTNQDPDAQKKAEAQQKALEYAYKENEMAEVLAEAAYWVGTDGFCALGPYWHPDKGPWMEAGQPAGDVRTCVYRIEQVRVSANATATEAPHYWILRETIPAAQAVAQHGVAVVNATDAAANSDQSASLSMSRYGLDGSNLDELLREQETVDRYTVYCEPSAFLPKGLTLITVGNVKVFVGPLLYEVVPLARMTDGSEDPAFFPTPVMNDWIPHQVRINALVSKWIESIRVNAGGRFLMKSGVVVTETLVGGTTSALEVKGAFNSINDAMTPVQGFSIGTDVKEALERERTTFEQKSGWNDASRGSFASTTSGRAILAVREQLERIYAPGVASAAHAMSIWGKIVLHIYKNMLSMPRAMAIVGKGRSDLGQQMTAEDFDGVSQVEIDPETLMPMPRSLKLSLLDQLYQTQVINAQEYRRRLPFAFTGSITTPDDAQDARAQRVCDAIRRGQPAPEVRWTDNEAIAQDALEREILLQDDLDPSVIAVATQRWVQLAQQSQMKQGGMPMPGPTGPASGGPPDASPLNPATAPLFGSNPSVAAQPQALAQADATAAGAQFDQTQPQ